jgi:hypothetical protein
MGHFGSDFIISSLIWLCIVLLFVFTFRHQLKKLFYKKTPFDIFLNKLKNYLEKNYPKINFDFSIIETSKKEENPDTRKYLIIDNIIDQYLALKIENKPSPKPISKNLQWQSYTFNCEPNRDKLPPDWIQRKNALLIRENGVCFRCNKHITIETSDIHMLRSLDQGGKYYLENLVPVCKDCKRVLSKDPKKLNHLDIKDDLQAIAKNY